jgi:hypothetical protein
MLTLYCGRGACSMAGHIVLEDSGEAYETHLVDLHNGAQKKADYLKVSKRNDINHLVRRFRSLAYCSTSTIQGRDRGSAIFLGG